MLAIALPLIAEGNGAVLAIAWDSGEPDIHKTIDIRRRALDEKEQCCYAQSDKYWVEDPQGIAWETFHSLGEIPMYGEDRGLMRDADDACCAPVETQPTSTAESPCYVPAGKNETETTARCE